MGCFNPAAYINSDTGREGVARLVELREDPGTDSSGSVQWGIYTATDTWSQPVGITQEGV